MKPNKSYSLHYEYKKYLKRLKVNEEEMHPMQKIQLHQFFMAGAVSGLFLFKQITEIKDPLLVKHLIDNLIKEADDKNT